MAAASADIFEDGGVLLAEAGTGTGKTLAYLVPAILSGHRVLVSTGTKNLQDQIYHKDLPALREALDVPFTATYMKGRGNYLCLHRFDAIREDDQPRSAVDLAYLETLREWATQTETGDRAEVEDLPDDLPLWHEISASSENCIGTECPTVSRLLRHADAAKRGRIRPGHREPPSALRRRGRSTERVRRGDPLVCLRRDRRGPPAGGRRNAVLRCRPQQLSARRAGAKLPTCTRRGAAGGRRDGGRREEVRGPRGGPGAGLFWSADAHRGGR